MAGRSRNDEEKLARREAILDAAEKAFREQRFDQTAMDAIAKSAGLSRALLYVYFRDKADIHTGLCVRAAEVLTRRMQAYRDRAERGLDKVRALGTAYLDFYHEEPEYFQILVQGTGLSCSASRSPATEVEEAMFEKERALMGVMAEAVAHGVSDGSIAPHKVQDPLETAMFLRSCLHGAVMVQDVNGSPIFQHGRLSRTRLLTYTVDMLTSSLV